MDEGKYCIGSRAIYSEVMRNNISEFIKNPSAVYAVVTELVKYNIKAMRLLPFFLVAIFLVTVSCRGEKPEPEELAARAAREYYGHLAAGRYDDYLAGVAGTDSIPASYREQLLVNAKQFMALQTKVHHGIGDIQVVRASADSSGRYAEVFLLLCFGDSAKEEIVVPMVDKGGRWMMR